MEIKENERFKIVSGGTPVGAMYSNVTAVQSYKDLVLASLDNDPGWFAIYTFDGNSARVLLNPVSFGQGPEDKARNIPGRTITTTGREQAQAKFNELVAARKSADEEAEARAAAEQARAEQRARAESERTRKILAAKKLRDLTRQELREAIKQNRDIEDRVILNLITKLQSIETYIKHI